MPEPEFVTVAEAARALQLSERQVRRYAGRLAESDRLTPDATTGTSPARVRFSALAALAGKVISEGSALPETSGSSPAHAGHDDRPPGESVRHVSGVASGAVISEEVAALRQQLATVTAERDGLTLRLADTASDRDAWKAQAQDLTQALQRAQDEARAARLIGGRGAMQIEATGQESRSGTPDGPQSSPDGSGGVIASPDTVRAPWWAFWKGKG